MGLTQSVKTHFGIRFYNHVDAQFSTIYISSRVKKPQKHMTMVNPSCLAATIDKQVQTSSHDLCGDLLFPFFDKMDFKF